MWGLFRPYVRRVYYLKTRLKFAPIPPWSPCRLTWKSNKRLPRPSPNRGFLRKTKVFVHFPLGSTCFQCLGSLNRLMAEAGLKEASVPVSRDLLLSTFAQPAAQCQVFSSCSFCFFSFERFWSLENFEILFSLVFPNTRVKLGFPRHFLVGFPTRVFHHHEPVVTAEAPGPGEFLRCEARCISIYVEVDYSRFLKIIMVHY